METTVFHVLDSRSFPLTKLLDQKAILDWTHAEWDMYMQKSNEPWHTAAGQTVIKRQIISL